MTMKRFIVTPFEWGTSSGYDFLNNDNPEADIIANPHISWAPANIVFERSFRIWEPGRMALSSMGVTDPTTEQQFNVPQIPQGAKIHGIKGVLTIQPAATAVFYSASTGEELDPQPGYHEIFDPWNQLYTNQAGADLEAQVRPGFSQGATVSYTRDPQHWSQCPFFITMYKGTFNPYGGTYVEGASIDSGPNDDPDTLLGVDITNPTVLEQERIVWWDMELCTMPHRSISRIFPAHLSADESILSYAPEFGPWAMHVKKYSVNLDRNWIVKDDQVLWLHVSPGIVDTGFLWQDPLGNTHRVMYRPGFVCDLVASMLATPFTPGV